MKGAEAAGPRPSVSRGAHAPRKQLATRAQLEAACQGHDWKQLANLRLTEVQVAELTSLGVPRALLSAHQTAGSALAAKQAALRALEAQVRAAKVEVAQQRAAMARANSSVMGAAHALRVRHNAEGRSLLLQQLEREDTRVQLLQPEYWGVLGMWKLRSVCRALREWVPPMMCRTPRVLAVGGTDVSVRRADDDEYYSDSDEGATEVFYETLASQHCVGLDLATLKWGWVGEVPNENVRKAMQSLRWSSPKFPPPLPGHRSEHYACTFQDGSIIVVGGKYSGYSMFNQVNAVPVFRWTPGNQEWTELPSVPGHRQYAAMVALDDGRTLLVGGTVYATSKSRQEDLRETEDEARSKGVMALDNTLGESPSWTVLAPMAVDRAGAVAVKLRTGKVLVAGGKTKESVWFDGDGMLDSAELFDPATNSWSPLPSMSSKRTDATASLLPSGRVIVFGGTHVDADGPFAETFDPDEMCWEAAGTWDKASDGPWHRSAILVPGGLLVAGGYTNENPDVEPCGLYDEASDRWFTLPNSSGRAYTQLVAVAAAD
jgi:hypothetical protein